MNNVFVAFEGIDASGKATQSGLLAKRLGAVLYSFPKYDTPMGKMIAAHLQREWSSSRLLREGAVQSKLSGEEWDRLDPLVFQSLMLTNRMEVAAELQNHLLDSKSVVCDRYWASGYAYGKADGLDPDYLVGIHDFLPKPDLQILIDIDPSDSLRRRPDRRDRYEKQPGLMDTVAENYRELWKKKMVDEPEHWVIIDGRKPVEEVTSAVLEAVEGVAYGDSMVAPLRRQRG